ncbi:HNH endonuclease [Streptomyces sp. NPDC051776]|uniref:HNH endonuclease n=1 Tax=Streptomyces sp. NPDC051776 TaxID=3155414 RepID=UPI00343F78D4
MSLPARYTRDRLVEAAAVCRDIDEVIAFFGTRPYHQLRRHLIRRFEHFGIDISHFPQHGPRGIEPRPSKPELEEAVRVSVSVAATLRRLNRPVNTGMRRRVSQWIAEDGLDTSHFLGQAHQRDRPGRDRRPADQVLVVQADHRRTSSSVLRRALREIGVPERCSACDTGTSWNGRLIVLEIDHINGDWRDNRAKNLRYLCPNCHAITDTWCRRGGKSRTDSHS